MYKKMFIFFLIFNFSLYLNPFENQINTKSYCLICKKPLNFLETFYLKDQSNPYCLSCYKKLQNKTYNDEIKEKKEYQSGKNYYEQDIWELSLKDIEKIKKYRLKKRFSLSKNSKRLIKKILKIHNSFIQNKSKQPSYFCYIKKTPTGFSDELVMLEYYKEEDMPEYDLLIASLPKTKDGKTVRYFCYKEETAKGLSDLKILEYFDEETIFED